MLSNERIAFIGAGSMAEAIIAGLLEKGILSPQQIRVTNRSNEDKLRRLTEIYNIKTSTKKENVVTGATIIILAVKPKDIHESMQMIADLLSSEQLVVSVLAGISTDLISALLTNNTPVIRAMPNTSAAVGQSATAIAKGKYATQNHLQKAKALFAAIGSVASVSEEQLHAVTGLSGSGPAYLYYMAEAFEETADQLGLEQTIAKELIRQTFIGAAEMLKQTDEPPASLRKKVTSPGGTTEAGIKSLEQRGFKQAVNHCIRSAVMRSQQLSGNQSTP